jgi:hypothetical protein
VVATHRKHAEAREQVEILIALVVVEIGTTRAHVVPVEADRLEHAHVLRIEVALVQIELLALSLADQIQDALRHALGVLARGSRSQFESGGRGRGVGSPRARGEHVPYPPP